MHEIDSIHTINSIIKLSNIIIENNISYKTSDFFKILNNSFKKILKEENLPKQVLTKEYINYLNNKNLLKDNILDYMKIIIEYGWSIINTTQSKLLDKKNLIINDIIKLYNIRWFHNGKESLPYGRFVDYMFFNFFEIVLINYKIKLVNFDFIF